MTKKEVSEMEDIYDCNHDCANCPLAGCGTSDDNKDDDEDEDDNN